MTGKTQADRRPHKMLGLAAGVHPQSLGHVIAWGDASHRGWKLMTACLGQGGRPGQGEGGGEGEREEGGDLAGFAQTNLFIFPDWKKLFGLCTFAESHGIYYASWLNRFLFVIQSNAACIFHSQS